LQPANPKFLNDVGFAQLAAGQPAAAVDALRAAHELDSGSVTVRNNLILALHLSGQDGAARDLISTITPEAAAQQAAALLQVTAGQVGAAPAAVSAAGAGAPPAMTAAIVPASREALR
jgi:Flp pilus assembly protein TadD